MPTPRVGRKMATSVWHCAPRRSAWDNALRAVVGRSRNTRLDPRSVGTDGLRILLRRFAMPIMPTASKGRAHDGTVEKARAINRGIEFVNEPDVARSRPPAGAPRLDSLSVSSRMPGRPNLGREADAYVQGLRV